MFFNFVIYLVYFGDVPKMNVTKILVCKLREASFQWLYNR